MYSQRFSGTEQQMQPEKSLNHTRQSLTSKFIKKKKKSQDGEEKQSLNTETCGCIKLKDTSEFCEFPGYMTTFCIYTFQLKCRFCH